MYALRYIVSVQIKAGDITGAKQTAESISDIKAKTSALCSIASSQAQTGNLTEAKQTLSIASREWRALRIPF